MNGEQKAQAREDRLTMRPYQEEKLRKELKAKAFDYCREYLDGYAKCAKEEGLMVVINCRPVFKDLNKCLDTQFDDEKFAAYCVANGYKPPERNSFIKILTNYYKK